MRKMSAWAKQHPWSARIIIVVSFILLNTAGYTTGLMLQDSGINLPVAAILFFCAPICNRIHCLPF